MDERVERNLALQEFIAKEVRRYCNIFEKNEGKETFVHTNWAAFFFGPVWMFYRSMVVWGIIGLVLQYIIYYVAYILMVAVSNPGAPESGTTVDVYLGCMIGATVVVLVARLIFSLFADCIYRAYVNRNLGRTEGGVSIGGFIVGSLFNSAISWALGEIASGIILAIVLG